MVYYFIGESMSILIDNDFCFDKSVTLCFTGHRSQKLPWGFNEEHPQCIKMKDRLYKVIENCIQYGYTNFLCGMALGFDMICASILLDLKNTYPQIKVYGILPCKDQHSMWPEKEKQRYNYLLSKLDGIRCKYDKYNSSECMLERNNYMINNSSLLVALFDGKPGGTQSTILKAEKANVRTFIIKP